MINLFCLLIFILCKEQKVETWFVSKSASREYFGFKPTTFLSANWQSIYPLVKLTAKCFLFDELQKWLFQWIGVQLQLLCTNDPQLQRCSQRSCFRFCTFGFQGLPPVCIAYPLRIAAIDLLLIRRF